MKLQANAERSGPTVAMTLDQDGGDVNIRANGSIIGYFRVHGGKLSLELIRLSLEDKSIVNADDGWLMVVR